MGKVDVLYDGAEALPESSALSSALAKSEKHSAKTLPSVTLDKEISANSTSATTSLSSTFYQALDKVFAECHSVLGKEKWPSRRLVTETATLLSVLGDTRQRNYLCRVSNSPHSQRVYQRDPLSASLLSAFGGTRQSLLLCRMPVP
jgi:hypothetical protein